VSVPEVSLSEVISSKVMPDTKIEFRNDFRSLLSALDKADEGAGYTNRHFLTSWNGWPWAE
jgi:hypothetical protein